MAEITLDDFRTEVTAFLDADATPRPDEQKFVWGEGDDKIALFEEKDPAVERAELAEAKAFRAQRYDAGLGLDLGTGAVRRPGPAGRLRAGVPVARGRATTCPVRASSASASAWWRRRSSPTPPTR